MDAMAVATPDIPLNSGLTEEDARAIFAQGNGSCQFAPDALYAIKPEVAEHTIHRDWCPHCRKKVEQSVPDAMSGATLGNGVLVLSAWLHHALCPNEECPR